MVLAGTGVGQQLEILNYLGTGDSIDNIGKIEF
jgi:hypothetical protein